MNKIEFLPLKTIPQVKPGDDLGEIISQAAGREIGSLRDKDIAIITMKIVSKAEGCLIHLDQVSPSERARRIARKTGKPVQLTQTILDHSEKIVGVIPFHKLMREGIVDSGTFSREPERHLNLSDMIPLFW
jgi:coenzyme F420-0:L-glutamate ligase/coenzyme F420-1:gamma-L-glutamate ligase